jgi:predicted nucleic acid-binding protein
MRAMVLDCSAVLAWFFEDERDADALRLIDALGSVRAHVPSLWPYEIANVMLVAERRGRLKAASITEGLDAIEALDIVIEPGKMIERELIALARQNNLSVYDASYLALARHLKLPLATRDKALKRAAQAVGVKLF